MMDASAGGESSVEPAKKGSLSIEAAASAGGESAVEPAKEGSLSIEAAASADVEEATPVLMPGLGDLLELATTPRERLPSTEGETDIGKWLASIGAPDSAEDIFLEKEIDTLGELADAVATEDDLAQLLGADFVGVGWDVVLRLKRAGLQDAGGT
jgi:hypothetical protein